MTEKYTVVVTDALALHIGATEVMAENEDDAKRVVFKDPKDRILFVSKSEDFNGDCFGGSYKHYVERLYEGNRNLSSYLWFNTYKAAIEAYIVACHAPDCCSWADSETTYTVRLQEQQCPKKPANYCVRAFDIENRLWREVMCDTEEECLEKTKTFVNKYIRFPVKAYKRNEEERDAWNIIFSTSGLYY